MNENSNFQALEEKNELDELLMEFPDITPVKRSIFDEYSQFLAVVLTHKPVLSYAKMTRLLNLKLKRDGRTGPDGKPLTITRQGINNFVLRRKARSDKRAAEARALQSHGVAKPNVPNTQVANMGLAIAPSPPARQQPASIKKNPSTGKSPRAPWDINRPKKVDFSEQKLSGNDPINPFIARR